MKHTSRYIGYLSLIVLICACNPSKKLAEGEYLLNKNTIHGNIINIDRSDIESYIRIKPNYKLLGLFRFNLFLYNIANEKRIKKKEDKYTEKLKRKNERRIAKNKTEKTYHPHIFGKWLINIGEPPVKYDSFLVEKSAQQLKIYLNNKGYFLSSVKDSIIHKRRKKVNVVYKITLNHPYKIKNITYEIPDSTIKQFVISDTSNTLLKPNNNYDLDLIQEERERITYLLNNEGYYSFTKESVYFKIDTISQKEKVNIIIGIKNNFRIDGTLNDSIIEEPHKRYFIRDIYIETNFSPAKNDTIKNDTMFAGNKRDYRVVYPQKIKYKTKVLTDAIYLNKDSVYRFKNVELTYKRLAELKEFKYINIYFKNKFKDSLDCFVQLTPLLKQSITLEQEGTNASGNLGISGSVIYQNKNLFKGAELLELRLKGGVSAQRVLNQETQSGISSKTATFNTFEFGPELNLYIPRFLFLKYNKLSKLSNPKTAFTSGLNYQRRPDYSRIITNFSLAYIWNQSSKIQHTFNPVMLNFVKVELDPSFSELLNKTQNKFVINSFSNHLNTSTRYSFTYNEQNLKKERNFSFFRINLESSGNALRGFYNLGNYIQPNTFVKDNQDRYTFLDIAYSQYLRTDFDYRYYINLHSLGKIALRFAAGIGRPLTNFKVLPFERSFFSGGTNSLRAWQARTIGPGSYSNQVFSYDRFGDGQLEGNIEHRFKIFKMLNGAIFVDAGNVWLQKPDSNRPGGDFEYNRFYKEIAVGTGIGARFDFSFFIIRLDMGIKARDPQFAESDRWVLQHLFSKNWKQEYKDTYNTKYNFTTFNLGIGYPF